MSSSVDPWTETFRVRSDEITPHGTVSVPALCTYLQEAAGHHADALGVSIQQLHAQGQAWVLAHLQVQIDRLPRWESDVVVETWPSGLDGLYATREFQLRDEDGPVARATSAWFVLDTERRRPVRPPRRLYDISVPERPPALDHEWDDLPPPEHAGHERTFDVRYHDLDVNRHVNNVRLLEWALETLPPEVHDAYRCAGVGLQFVGETRVDDTVLARAEVQNENGSLGAAHELRHAKEDRTVAVAHSRWLLRSGEA